MVAVAEFSGADDHVLRHVPASRPGALRLVCARRFRLEAAGRLIGRRLAELTGVPLEASQHGGHWVYQGQAPAGVEKVLSLYQVDLDKWCLAAFRGAVVVHLAAARGSWDESTAKAIEAALVQRRARPLEHALTSGGRWNTTAFHAWTPEDETCPGCGDDARLSEGLCDLCRDDLRLAERLTATRAASFVPAAEGELRVPGAGLALGSSGEWTFSELLPMGGDGQVLEFPDLADRSPGRRKELGYLAACDLPPLGAEIEASFPLVVRVGNGAQTHHSRHTQWIGPWDEALRLALKIREAGEYGAALSVAAAAREMRPSMKRSLAALRAGCFAIQGLALEWTAAAELAQGAFGVAQWLEQGRLGEGMLGRIADLRRASRLDGAHWDLRRLPALARLASESRDGRIRNWIEGLAGPAGTTEWENFELLTWLALGAASPKRVRVSRAENMDDVETATSGGDDGQLR